MSSVFLASGRGGDMNSIYLYYMYRFCFWTLKCVLSLVVIVQSLRHVWLFAAPWTPWTDHVLSVLPSVFHPLNSTNSPIRWVLLSSCFTDEDTESQRGDGMGCLKIKVLERRSPCHHFVLLAWNHPGLIYLVMLWVEVVFFCEGQEKWGVSKWEGAGRRWSCGFSAMVILLIYLRAFRHMLHT